MEKAIDDFNDMFGLPLAVDDFVITLYDDESTHLYLAKILGFTEHYLRLEFMQTEWRWKEWEKKIKLRGKFSGFVKVPKEHVTMYYLKNEISGD